jgi:hypothetical protein
MTTGHFDLTGRRVPITGPSQSIGLALARHGIAPCPMTTDAVAKLAKGVATGAILARFVMGVFISMSQRLKTERSDLPKGPSVE